MILVSYNFVVRVDLRVKMKESENISKYLDPARELKTVEHEDDSDTDYLGTALKGLEKRLKELDI